MKKLFLSIAIVTSGAFAMAQQASPNLKQVESSSVEMKVKSKSMSQEDRMAKMKAELGLSDAQVSQIKALQEKNKQESIQAMKEAKEDRSALRKAQVEKNKAEMKAILTPDQVVKWEANKMKKRSNKATKKTLPTTK